VPVVSVAGFVPIILLLLAPNTEDGCPNEEEVGCPKEKLVVPVVDCPKGELAVGCCPPNGTEVDACPNAEGPGCWPNREVAA
jgi:hypothetical protein